MAISASYEKNGTQAALPQAKAKRGARTIFAFARQRAEMLPGSTGDAQNEAWKLNELDF